MSQDVSRESELVLPPGVFAFVLDKTKGNVTCYSGPTKSSLSQTDQTVTFDARSGRYIPCNIEDALQTNIVARKGEYIVLRNASKGKQPEPGKSEVLSDSILNVGTTVNISGPANFALWPGQTAEVISGHHLRSNRYVVARVYDEDAAQENWNEAVVKLADDTNDSDDGEAKKKAKKETKSTHALGLDPSQLTTGKLLIIKGTSVSFYIPPTGIEVLQDDNGEFVRDAVTLERLEYCILLDENGNKRYVRGPEVVFPAPTEQFVISQDKGKRKFRAYELNENSGLYIKVIADYDDHKAGDELFITGKDTAIYFPRPEHAIIKYGDQEKHYAVAIPAGEARYVLNRDNGSVNLVTGPEMFMPDPRKEVMVRRILDDHACNLYFPGNYDVLEYNRRLKDISNGSGYAEDSEFESFGASMAASNLDDGGGGNYTRGYTKTKKRLAAKGEFADSIGRGTEFTPPRTITLDTKLDGAVSVEIWTGFAVQIVNKLGERRVVTGPQTVTLEYDEYLEAFALSKGRPKNPDDTLKTVYLRTMSNPVTDRIKVSTSDLVDLSIDLKYLVRFTGDGDKWFNVDNYVQYMCDHMRSLLGNQIRQINIQDFYSSAVEQLRDIILGKKVDDEARPNKVFEENSMEIYDVEVISISFVDRKIENLIEDSKQEELKNTIELAHQQHNLTLIRGKEEAKRAIDAENAKSAESKSALRLQEAELRNTEHEADEAGKLKAEEVASKVRKLVLDDEKKAQAQREHFEREALVRRIEEFTAMAQADATRASAVQPALIRALQAMAETGTLQQIAQHLAPLSIVRNESLGGTLGNLLKGTPMEGLLENISELGTGQFIDARDGVDVDLSDEDDESAA